MSVTISPPAVPGKAYLIKTSGDATADAGPGYAEASSKGGNAISAAFDEDGYNVAASSEGSSSARSGRWPEYTSSDQMNYSSSGRGNGPICGGICGGGRGPVIIIAGCAVVAGLVGGITCCTTGCCGCCGCCG